MNIAIPCEEAKGTLFRLNRSRSRWKVPPRTRFRPDMKSLAKEELKKFTGGEGVGKAAGLLKGLLGGKKQ